MLKFCLLAILLLKLYLLVGLMRQKEGGHTNKKPQNKVEIKV